MVTVEECKTNKSETCEKILRSLPKWFGIESAILKYVRDVESMPMFVASVNQSGPVGFLALNRHNEFNYEIHVMAVLPEYHGKGIGKALIGEAEQLASARGAKFLTVKTLSPARENAEYELTRRFYLSVGFLPLEEFKTLWGENNPCLMMIKDLSEVTPRHLHRANRHSPI